MWLLTQSTFFSLHTLLHEGKEAGLHTWYCARHKSISGRHQKSILNKGLMGLHQKKFFLTIRGDAAADQQISSPIHGTHMSLVNSILSFLFFSPVLPFPSNSKTHHPPRQHLMPPCCQQPRHAWPSPSPSPPPTPLL